MKQTPKLILITLFLLVGILSVVHVIVANSLSTSGVILNSLEQERNELQKQNAMLAEQMLLASSYNNIASKAGELGLVSRQRQVYINNPPLALRP